MLSEDELVLRIKNYERLVSMAIADIVQFLAVGEVNRELINKTVSKIIEHRAALRAYKDVYSRDEEVDKMIKEKGLDDEK